MNKPFTPPSARPPHNMEAEQALLGAILVNNEAFYSRLRFPRAEAFLRNHPSATSSSSPAGLSAPANWRPR